MSEQPKSICKGMTQGRSYMGKAEKPRPCLYPANEDGFCKLHDPRIRFEKLKKREKRFAAQLADVQGQIAEIIRNHGDLLGKKLRPQ